MSCHPPLSRRHFCGALLASAASVSLKGQTRFAALHAPTEWSLESGKHYSDPFNDVELDVLFTSPSARQMRVPAFWAGGTTWRVRFAAQEVGRYSYTTICSDSANRDLHARAGTLNVTSYSGDNPLYERGFVRVGDDQRHFHFADGTPFFWLGDTWWMGLTNRLSWPDGFQTLTADRVAKGFSVVQIVAGLYPDMPPFDSRGTNEAGFPWQQDFARINPAYFDMADLRIQHLVDQGIVPCIVGCWGYFLPIMGVAKMKQHWRYLIARWGAYPVIWCLAGEGAMPYYLSKTHDTDAATQKHGWTELARYVRTTDAFAHPITIHPSRSARNCVDDASVLDFDMLQTGHDDRRSAPSTVETILNSSRAEPKMPVLVGEVCYEGIMEASREEVQRYMFWAAILSGAAGHTYGANGIWQVNTREKPYGLSPHGHGWGDTPWEVAYQLPGSRQLGLAKGLLTRYRWWKLESRPDLVEPHWNEQNYWQPFAAHIPGELIVAFTPSGGKALRFKEVSAGMQALFWNPTDGSEHVMGPVMPDGAGNWQAPEFPIFRDWVVVLESASARMVK
jgi:hypothetical protein